MGDGGADGEGEGGRGRAPGAGAGDGAGTAPPRPARAEFPPTDGEIAARRLVAGHLDTSGLDPVTAKAVELLVGADAVAAEQYHAPRRRRDRLTVALLAVMVTNVATAAALGVVVHQQSSSEAERATIANTSKRTESIAEQIKSCVDPEGECAKRGQATTAEAVAALNRATLVIVKCADEYDGADAIDRCVAARLPDRD